MPNVNTGMITIMKNRKLTYISSNKILFKKQSVKEVIDSGKKIHNCIFLVKETLNAGDNCSFRNCSFITDKNVAVNVKELKEFASNDTYRIIE